MPGFGLVLLKRKHSACQFVILLKQTKRLGVESLHRGYKERQHLLGGGKKKKGKKSKVRVSIHTTLNFFARH